MNHELSGLIKRMADDTTCRIKYVKETGLCIRCKRGRPVGRGLKCHACLRRDFKELSRMRIDSLNH